MSILNKRELLKILKHKRKLNNFYTKLWRLSMKAPNRTIKEILRKAMSECGELIDALTGAAPLEEQKKDD